MTENTIKDIQILFVQTHSDTNTLYRTTPIIQHRLKSYNYNYTPARVNPVEFMPQQSVLGAPKQNKTLSVATQILMIQRAESGVHAINQLLTLHARQSRCFSAASVSLKTPQNKQETPQFISNVCICVMDAWLQKTRRRETKRSLHFKASCSSFYPQQFAFY